MLIDTDRLVELCQDYETIMDSQASSQIDLDTELELIKPIYQEVERLGSLICHASSLVVVAGLETERAVSGVANESTPSFVGISPQIHSIRYPESPLGGAREVTSLVFETYDDENFTSDLRLSAVQLFPYAALPLTEPHRLEAIGRIYTPQ